MSPKFKPQIIKNVASMYISATGNQVSGISAGPNESSMCICDKLYCGHALREQVTQVVYGINASRQSSNLKKRNTVASMDLSAAGNLVSGNLTGKNESSMCICDKLYCGHAF